MAHRQHISRDVRMHDVQHLNGAATPQQNGAQAISPAAPAGAPNGQAPSATILHKLNVANEQTWLLIGAHISTPFPPPTLIPPQAA